MGRIYRFAVEHDEMGCAGSVDHRIPEKRFPDI